MSDTSNIPKHIAIIMDGNGRWAKERSLPRSAGHRAGMDRVKEIIKAAAESNVSVLTLFAFSAENWKRSKGEVSMLMRSFSLLLGREINELHKNNVRFLVIGRDDPLPKYVRNKIRQAEEKTRDNTGMVLVIALNYGSRQEIIDAAKKFADSVVKGKAKLADLDSPDSFSRYLYTAGLPDPDLLIRTSGEMRISNFLLWQISYAELYFTDKFWPDFGADDLRQAIEEYKGRQRRFGGADVY